MSNSKGKRAPPGSKGEGNYYRIEVRDSQNYETFRYHDVGDKGGDLQRLAGQKSDGTWETQTWLVSKDSAHIEGDRLVPDSNDVEELFTQLETEPKHVKGDIFRAKDKEDRR